MSNLAEQHTIDEFSNLHIHHISKLVFNSNLHTLSSNSKFVYLRHQINHLLLMLIQSSNRAVSRDELIEKIWNGNKHTGQKALTHTVCKLRQILESLSAGDVSIITIPKFGYCLSRKDGHQ